MKFETQIDIDATPEAVWAVLADGSTWTQWDPNLERIEGTIEEGSTVTVYTKLSKQAFPVKVSEMVAPSRMVWTGGMPLGLFRGVRTFSLEPREGGCRFAMDEVFSGPLLFAMKGMLPDMNPVFRAFAEGLKKRAEG
jgi:hypothetical protein